MAFGELDFFANDFKTAPPLIPIKDGVEDKLTLKF